MQTFLAYDEFNESGRVLDPSRQNKQILETRQIMNVLYKKAHNLPVKGWANHPAVLMWEGFEWALLQYGHDVFANFAERTRKSHKAFDNMLAEHSEWADSRNTDQFPHWLGDDRLHSSHRTRLMHKGTLDIIRKAMPNRTWPKQRFSKELRDFTVEDVKFTCQLLDLCYGSVVEDSHYAQFGWSEKPGDDYIWPKDLAA